MSSWLKSFDKLHRILLGIIAVTVLAAILWLFIPCHIAAEPEEIRDIRVEYNYQEVTGFAEAQLAKFLCQVMGQRRLHLELNHTVESYSITAEISFFYGGKRLHLDLNGERGRCYGPGIVYYRVMDASSELRQLEELLSI